MFAKSHTVVSPRAQLSFAVTLLTLLAAVAVLFPLIWLVIAAFRNEADLAASPFGLNTGLTTHNFEAMLDIPGFGVSVRNSLLVAIVTTVLTTSVAIPTGYLISRYEFPWKTTLRVLSLCGYLLAPAVLALPYFQMLASVRLVDSLAGIVASHVAFTFPFALVLTELIVQAVPIELEEVAIIHGSGLIRRLFHVVIPTARYQVLAMLLLIFTISWKEFFFAFLISGGQDTRTLPVLLATLYGGEALRWPLVCALSTILLLPSCVLLFWRQTPFINVVAVGAR